MIRKYFALLLILCLCLIGCGSQQPTFQDSHGKRWQISDFQGKWTVLNYWAAWCGSCRKEIPALNAFYQEHKTSNNVRLVGVDYDGGTLETLQKTVAQVGIDFPILLNNPAKHFGIGAIPALPVSFVINPRGKIVKELYGPHSKQALDQILQGLMK